MGMINPEELKGLKQQFENMDTDGNGTLDTSELKRIFEKQGIKMDSKQIDKITRQLDLNGSGQVNYTEFLSATIDVSKHMTENKMKSIF